MSQHYKPIVTIAKTNSFLFSKCFRENAKNEIKDNKYIYYIYNPAHNKIYFIFLKSNDNPAANLHLLLKFPETASVYSRSNRFFEFNKIDSKKYAGFHIAQLEKIILVNDRSVQSPFIKPALELPEYAWCINLNAPFERKEETKE